MNEVSGKTWGLFFPKLKEKGISDQQLVEGTRVDVARLRQPKDRMDWADYCDVMRNMRKLFTDEEYVELGREYLRQPALKFVFVIARMLMSPLDFYRWFSKPREGVGNQMFTCIKPTHREISDTEIELDLMLPEGFEVCWDFFLISSGNMTEMPVLLGYAPAKVTLSRLEHGGRMHIVLPKKKPSLLRRILGALTWPFTARAAARELKAAHEDLQDRFEELEKTRLQLVEYQGNLEKLVDERTVELKGARDALSGTVDQLREAQTARERFFGNVSHEIRTPLTLIMLAARDIEARSGKLLDARSAQSLGSVSDASRKLVRLVDELLLLAAGQEGKFDIHREPTDLGALVHQLVGAWRPAAEQAGLELVATAPASLVANVDPIAIERVASNLMSNAVKYTPRGGKVELVLADDGARITFAVLDTGPGIADDLASRLFGRFERGAGDRRIAGTGIGLSLVKQLVESHDGTVEVTRRETGGTEMRVTLPRGTATSAPAPMRGLQLAPTEKSGSTASGTKFLAAGVSHGTIVIAEDDAGLAEATARLLSEKYTVIIGLDGLAALELVKQHQPQLLVTDIDMPGLNGIELAKQFRNAVGDQLAPIIMLSAVIDLGTRIAGLEAGAIDYVTKPFEPRELLARVDAQFRMRELAVRLQQAEQLSTLGILTSGLAHEIRNPANGIVNAIGPLSELLPRELIGPETGPGQLLEVMEECANQIRFLSKQLLGFRSGMQLEVAPAKASEVVGRALSLAQSAFSGVELRTNIAVDRQIQCSVPLLVQALTNLIDNATQAAGRGGWVEISTFFEGGRIAVEVADSGPGVPLALRDRIFQPFFTTKSPGEGTGLGLAMARAIVQRHGGNLEIRERGGRAAFVIDLPADSFAPSKPARYDEMALPS
ncbi:MAG: ATP-binding protein [Kofleriaceae bacterium]